MIDLNLYQSLAHPTKLIRSVLDEYLTSTFPEINKEGEDWTYENETTGATFEITYYDPEEDWEDDEHFEGFFNTGLNISLEAGFPENYGVECCRFLENICKEFALLIYDSNNHEKPVPFISDEVFMSWKDDNDWMNRIKTMNMNS